MPSSMWRPPARLVPVHERLRVVGEPVAPLPHREDRGLVDPAAEVGGAGHVGAHRHHPLGHLGRVVHEVDEEPAERLLRRFLPAVLAPQAGRHGRRRHRLRLLAREGGGRRRAQLALGAAGVEAGPGVVGVGAERLGQHEHLVPGQQRRVVLRVALDRQRPALDRVGEHHRRPVVLGAPVGVDQGAEVVAAEVAQAGPQLAVVELGDQPLQARRSRPAAARAAPQGWRAAGAGTPRSASRRCGAAGRGRPAARTGHRGGGRT